MSAVPSLDDYSRRIGQDLRQSPEFRVLQFLIQVDAAELPTRDVAQRAAAFIGNLALTDRPGAAAVAQELVRAWPREGADMEGLRSEVALIAKDPSIPAPLRAGARLLFDAFPSGAGSPAAADRTGGSSRMRQ